MAEVVGDDAVDGGQGGRSSGVLSHELSRRITETTNSGRPRRECSSTGYGGPAVSSSPAELIDRKADQAGRPDGAYGLGDPLP